MDHHEIQPNQPGEPVPSGNDSDSNAILSTPEGLYRKEISSHLEKMKVQGTLSGKMGGIIWIRWIFRSRLSRCRFSCGNALEPYVYSSFRLVH